MMGVRRARKSGHGDRHIARHGMPRCRNPAGPRSRIGGQWARVGRRRGILRLGFLRWNRAMPTMEAIAWHGVYGASSNVSRDRHISDRSRNVPCHVQPWRPPCRSLHTL